MFKEQYEKWLNYPDLDEALKEELLAMDEKTIQDAFYRNLEFGTAGMRGIMGPGPNRMNIYMIRKVSTGYAQYIIAQGKEAQERGVAIAYDNRYNSYNFALESAKIFAAFNIRVYLYTSLRPTPQLSFTIRYFNCFGGIVCTASHNPKEYNGYKLYDQEGCQMAPEIIEPIIANIEAIKDELSLNSALNDQQEKLITMIDSELDAAYIATLKTIQLYPEATKEVKVVFTPQHGTSRINMCRLFEETGYECYLVKEQAEPDPEFTNTLIANPEDPLAYVLALEYARKYDADIVLSTDPDGDRMGVQVKHNGEYVFLSGNQTGALLIEYICHSLKDQGKFPAKALVISTIVTNDLGNLVAESYGAKLVLSLTGFKFIGQRIAQYCDQQDYNFIFGYEESYGYIIKDFVRDKDGLQACLILAEAANYYKKQGLTLVDVVNKLYEKHGYYYDFQENTGLPGADGLARMQAIMKALRDNPPTSLGGLKVIVREDYDQLLRFKGDSQENISGFVASDVIKYFLENDSWVAVRPSGTEPKFKFYYCVKGPDLKACQDLTAKLKAALNELIH